MKNKKTLLIILSMLAVMFVLAITFFGLWRHQVSLSQKQYNHLASSTNKQISKAEKQKIDAEREYKEKIAENDNLTKHAIAANTDPKQESNQKFNDLTNQVMENFYTFTPKNYAKRKNIVKDKLSKDLFTTLYPTSNTSVNSAGTTSKFVSMQLFADTDPGITKSGLAMVKYKVKSGKDHYQEHTHMWKVDYDNNQNVITGLTDLGSPTDIGGN